MFVKEERPNPDPALVDRASSNLDALTPCVERSLILKIDVFESDGAVVGGRSVLREIAAFDLAPYSDIVIDASALSIGIGFPLVKYILSQSEVTGQNVHLFACDTPTLDHAIRAHLAERATNIHGFRKVNALYSAVSVAKLWLPQLAPSGEQALQRIFDEVLPNDACPDPKKISGRAYTVACCVEHIKKIKP